MNIDEMTPSEAIEAIRTGKVDIDDLSTEDLVVLYNDPALQPNKQQLSSVLSNFMQTLQLGQIAKTTSQENSAGNKNE